MIQKPRTLSRQPMKVYKNLSALALVVVSNYLGIINPPLEQVSSDGYLSRQARTI